MADAFEDEVEQAFTLDEYIEGLEAQELEADMVLGGDEGKECTYSNGYMKRQAIFSCLTCVPSGNAGVCTACSLSCHDGHEVVELWTKRKFRCDCGNSKFGDFCCKLFSHKDPENLENSYNHNFRGSYCTCGQPYPDPDASEQVEMIQCCICEDWFHENHLGLDSSGEVPRDEDGEPLYDEFICKDCAIKCTFLQFYPTSICASSMQNDAPNAHKEEYLSVTGTDACASPGKIKDDACVPEVLSSFPTMPAESGTVSSENSPLHIETSAVNLPLEKDDSDPSNGVLSSKCIVGMDLNATSVIVEKTKPMFLSKNWRDSLCRCDTCAEYYAKKGICYLTDKEDTIEEYEKMAKQRREETLQQREGAELNFLNNLNHVQKIEILNGINDMKDELHSFLESFDTSKPITSADVCGIFENLAKKRQRLQ